MRRAAFTLLLAVAFWSTAIAQPGLNLHWDECADGGGVMGKTFACDTDAGPAFSAYASIVVPTHLPAFAAASVIVDVCTSGPLPDWWQTAAGQCRAHSVAMSFGPGTNFSSCPDIWRGAHVVSALSVRPGVHGSNSVRFEGAAALPVGGELDLPADGAELQVCRVSITRARSAGPDACTGCSHSAELVLTEVRLQQPPGFEGSRLTTPASSNVAFWNLGSWWLCQTPAVNRTWGAVKSLYR